MSIFTTSDLTVVQLLLLNVMSTQRLFHDKLKAHRSIVDSTNANVLWYRTALCGAVVVCALTQLVYVHRLFERRRAADAKPKTAEAKKDAAKASAAAPSAAGDSAAAAAADSAKTAATPAAAKTAHVPTAKGGAATNDKRLADALATVSQANRAEVMAALAKPVYGRPTLGRTSEL
eukprot:TRINITY_DN4121_c0_g1_i2.p2 TRINITY_DN4121_c0_g1~~TRINITY_DN4121_c0_g1_i2.p2  ORF type:complete len:176 (-),score=51.35 TRINITY_DN4121_c0_g1_i2:82-609(-)